ncbi:MAG TPA: hypothetical protein VNE16_14470 [Vicinamibacterales bacterium]|nr:hypothetical protein [Vicinamibacterales bacterium]
MARCAGTDCRRWRPDVLVRSGRAGLRLDGAWYCSSACLQTALRRRLRNGRRVARRGLAPLSPIKLGVLLLVSQTTLTPTLLSEALDEQKRTGLRIGAQLQRMGLVSSEDVMRALAAQAGISYLSSVDPEPLTHAPGNLSRSAVQALGLVPIEVSEDKRLIKVACTAPLPRIALGALRELTGWMVQPYLVADNAWPALLGAYGTAADAGPRAVATPVRDLRDVAVRIAEVARQDPKLHLSHVRWDPYLWMRVEGTAHIEDLVLPMSDPGEDEPWAAEPTSH